MGHLQYMYMHVHVTQIIGKYYYQHNFDYNKINNNSMHCITRAMLLNHPQPLAHHTSLLEVV